MSHTALLVRSSTMALIAAGIAAGDPAIAESMPPAPAMPSRVSALSMITTLSVLPLDDIGQSGSKKAADKARDDKPLPPQSDNDALQDDKDKDVVVTGVRSSLAQARDKKKRADTIVDIVEADDIGKLPNNTVGDVIASIPGINVFRREGEVDNIQLRGLGGVQTTIGGTPIESGAARVASIADLPSDLIKSVEVYKTRTPDQVDGAGAGTINIQFRQPTDFNYGFTFSGNAAARYNNQARQYNQTYTGIVNYRFETGIGDLGAQLGFTWNKNPFLESQARNDPLGQVQTRQVVGPQILPLPTFAPNQIFFLYTTGARTTPSYSGSLQWTNDKTSIVLEGNYATPRFDRFSNQLYMPITIQATSTNALPALSNIKLVPGTNRIASVTVSPVNQVGPISYLTTEDSDNYLLKLSGRHSEDRFDATAEIAFTGGSYERSTLETRNRFVNRPVYDVEFASEKFRFPMMNLEFRNLDLLDPNQYRFFGVFQDQFNGKNSSVFSRADLTLRTFGKFIDRIQVGMRFTQSDRLRSYRSRNATGLQIPLGDLPPGWGKLVPIAEGFGGTGVVNNARWLSYDRSAARDDYDAMRQFLTPFFPAFATEEVPEDRSQYFRASERSVAAYATLYYETKLLFPISGLVGARVTNWSSFNLSYSSRLARRVVNGITTDTRLILPQSGRGNYVSVEPTATAVIKFTDKFQARLSYNVGIRRPDVGQVTPYISFSDADGFGTAGNPGLRPERTTRYDAILEYYFGRVGLVTINPFYWKLSNSIANFQTQELLESGQDGRLYTVTRPYNAGQGYRRGVEAQAQTFFTFLPGILKNFGASANVTYTESEQTFNSLPGSTTAPPVKAPIFGIAKYVYNVAGLFERGTLNARVSYNYNGTQLDQQFFPIENSSYIIPREWMDAAINYTIPNGPLKNLGFSIQVQNVLASARRSFYGYPDQPRDVIFMARTYGGVIRYRF